MHITLWILHVCSLQEGLEEVVRMVNFFQVYTLNHQLMEQLKGSKASIEICGQVIEVNWRHLLNCYISKSSLVLESLKGLNRRSLGCSQNCSFWLLWADAQTCGWGDSAQLVFFQKFQRLPSYWSCGLSRQQPGIVLFSSILSCPEFKIESCILRNGSAFE